MVVTIFPSQMASSSTAAVGMDTHSQSNKVSRSFEVVAVAFRPSLFVFMNQEFDFCRQNVQVQDIKCWDCYVFQLQNSRALDETD